MTLIYWLRINNTVNFRCTVDQILLLTPELVSNCKSSSFSNSGKDQVFWDVILCVVGWVLTDVSKVFRNVCNHTVNDTPPHPRTLESRSVQLSPMSVSQVLSERRVSASLCFTGSSTVRGGRRGGAWHRTILADRLTYCSHTNALYILHAQLQCQKPKFIVSGGHRVPKV